MTECNAERIHFSRVGRRQVGADFNGGRLTSDTGVLLLREVDQQIGLIDAINDCLPDPRDQRFTIHEQREMIAQRVYSIALGYEDLNDQQTLRDDPALQLAAGKSPEPDDLLASPWLNLVIDIKGYEAAIKRSARLARSTSECSRS